LSYETIVYRKAEKVTRITLNRSEVLNTLNGQMLRELPEAIAGVAKDNDVRVVTIAGSGRSLCAGGDHRYIETLTGSSEGVVDFGFSEREHIKFL